MADGYRWGDPNNPRVEGQEAADLTDLIEQAGRNCGVERWTFKLYGGPRDGMTGTMAAPTKMMRIPEGFYRREGLASAAPHEVTYQWIGASWTMGFVNPWA